MYSKVDPTSQQYWAGRAGETVGWPPMPPPLAPLSEAELEHFIQHGYLIKRAVMDPELCRAARETMWARNESALAPQHPSGPFEKSDERGVRHFPLFSACFSCVFS